MIRLIKSKFFDWNLFFLYLYFGLASAAIFSYSFIDFPLLENITLDSLPFYVLFKAMSLCIFPPLYLVVFGGGVLWFRFLSKSKIWTLPFFEIFTAQAFATAFVRIFKVIIGRARPESFLSNPSISFKCFSYNHNFHSFPSGHTIAAFTLAASIALLFPRFQILSLSLAFLLSLSRIFLLDHFLSDLFATAIIGMMIAQMVHLMLQKVTGKKSRRYANGTTPITRDS